MDFTLRLPVLHFGSCRCTLLCVFIRPPLLVLLVWRGITFQVPRIVHHESEVVIIVYGRGDVLVVLHKLLHAHLAVGFRVVPHIQMRLECLQKLNQHRLFCPFALDDIGVLVSSIRIFDIVDVEEAGPILVNLSESLLNKSQALVVQLAPNGHQELINVQSAVSVRVERIEECGNVLLGNASFEIATSLGKLLLRERLGAIVVHDLEQALNAYDASGASRLDLVSEEPNQSFRANVTRLARTIALNCGLLLAVFSHGLRWGLLLRAISTLKNCRKLFVVNSTVSAAVVVVKDHFQVLLKHSGV